MSIAVIVIVLVIVIIFAVKSGNATSNEKYMGRPPSAGLLNDEDKLAVQELIDNGRKIEAIKLCRESTGLGLKDRKSVV